jgi:hypothetical protein
MNRLTSRGSHENLTQADFLLANSGLSPRLSDDYPSSSEGSSADDPSKIFYSKWEGMDIEDSVAFLDWMGTMESGMSDRDHSDSSSFYTDDDSGTDDSDDFSAGPPLRSPAAALSRFKSNNQWVEFDNARHYISDCDADSGSELSTDDSLCDDQPALAVSATPQHPTEAHFLTVPTPSSSDDDHGSSRGQKTPMATKQGDAEFDDAALESALDAVLASRSDIMRAERIEPHLRTTKKALLQKFRKLGHIVGEEVKVYKWEANIEHNIEIMVPTSELEASSATFCFLGHWPTAISASSRNWYFSMSSSVPTQEADGNFVWRLDSQTLSAIEYDPEANGGLMTIYFGIFGWHPEAHGVATVSPPPGGLDEF